MKHRQSVPNWTADRRHDLTMGIALLCVALGFSACSGKARRQAELERAFNAGLQQGRQSSAPQYPPITLHGPVRHPTIPWSEGLTLARALVMAEITSLGTPRAIQVIRQGQVQTINPRQLGRGEVDVDLEPGDVIEVIR